MSLTSSARRIARLLKASGRKVVFAESCTGGLVSGALTKIPGISDFHCGGVVVYRNETKMAYLGIPAAVLKKPGPVSSEVAELMALNVLKMTPEADVAVSVTGYLGPNAPLDMDGVAFCTIAWRKAAGGRSPAGISTRRLQCGKDDARVRRQHWVVEQVLELLGADLDELSDR